MNNVLTYNPGEFVEHRTVNHDQIRTKSGLAVRIFMTDGGGEYPVIGAVRDRDTGEWSPEAWTLRGRYCLSASSDLAGMDLDLSGVFAGGI